VVLAVGGVVVLGVLGMLGWSAFNRSALRLPPSPLAATPFAPGELAAPPVAAPIVDRKPALAVLAFATIARDGADDHFADGITEELAAALARMPGIVVTTRGTGLALKGRPGNAKDIGRALGVAHLLTGSVTRNDTHVRLIARVVETSTGLPVWQEIFDRPNAELFVVEQELVEHAMKEIAPEARPGPGERPVQVDANALAAHELTLRSRHALRARNPDAVREARKLAEQAVGRDAEFAPGYLAFAAALAVLIENRWDRDYASAQLAQRMTGASHAAANLVPMSADAHALLAVAQTFSMQHDAAAIEAERALTLAPEDGEVIALAAKAMLGLGRFERAVTLLRKAQLLDPAGASLDARATLGVALYQLKRYADAVEALRACAPAAAKTTFCRAMLAAALAQAGLGDEAKLEVEALQRTSPGFTIAENSRREAAIARDLAWVRHTADGLRKAGVPD
jgi:adenylate cyclase